MGAVLFLAATSQGAASAAPTEVVTVAITPSTEPGAGSQYPSISADGRYVAFESPAPNLVTDDTNAVSDVFVYDCVTGTTTRVSVDSLGVQGNSDSYDPSISGDGRYVAFNSSASNLVAGDTIEGEVYLLLEQKLQEIARAVGKMDE